jgi:hypothetical protein
MISEKEKEMARYIADVHNLANKGIKGRGKAGKVKRILPHPLQQVPPTTTSIISTAAAHAAPYLMPLTSHGLPHFHTPPPQQPAAPQGHPSSGFSNPAAYSMSQTRETSSLHPPFPVMHFLTYVHQELAFGDQPHVHKYEHDRELTFGGRLY